MMRHFATPMVISFCFTCLEPFVCVHARELE